jgi:hypothetical protein
VRIPLARAQLRIWGPDESPLVKIFALQVGPNVVVDVDRDFSMWSLGGERPFVDLVTVLRERCAAARQASASHAADESHTG